jgi:hypothetical protein
MEKVYALLMKAVQAKGAWRQLLQHIGKQGQTVEQK